MKRNLVLAAVIALLMLLAAMVARPVGAQELAQPTPWTPPEYESPLTQFGGG